MTVTAVSLTMKTARVRHLSLHATSTSTSHDNDSPSVSEALSGPQADMWREAMRSELESLHANQTWCLTERPSGARVLPTKWVLKIKRDAAGNIERFKARLVAKGFLQVSGVDVGDVYAPVSKHTTLRTVLAKAAAENMEIHQLDFETAFLNGKLEEHEVIYVQQPEGFEEGSSNTVCRLQKALTHTVAHLRTRSDWSARNLDALSATHGTKAFLCKAPAHSMAIRKHDGAWYLLDSQADAPTRLRSTGHYMYPATCEIQAIISTANHTAEMEAARQRARLGPIISNPQETHRPYWERQYKQCCLVHAINMAMGIPMIRPDDVITHCKTLDTHIQDLANKARQENRPIPLRSSLPHIYEESGNFTVSTMNHYLYHHHKDLHLCPTATELTLGNITPELLTTLTGNIDSYTNTAAILITNNHATTIRRTDHTWHWLDSEQGRPCRLDTPEDWLQLK
ncbi:hypothetical protein QJQ45_015027, partial [Haematococcus lacustris]